MTNTHIKTYMNRREKSVKSGVNINLSEKKVKSGDGRWKEEANVHILGLFIVVGAHAGNWWEKLVWDLVLMSEKNNDINFGGKQI